MKILDFKIILLCMPLFCTLYFTVSELHAGPRVIGNGGDVIKCEDSRPLELLDYFEAVKIRGWSIDLGNGETSKDMVEFAIRRLESYSPTRAELYRNYASTFFEEAKFLEETNLTDIPDSNHIALPRGCSIAQIANQSEPLFDGDKRYLIANDIWKELPERDQAGLILHEIIYREAISLGHSNSVSVRILNAVISSNRINQMSIEEFTVLLADLGFESTTIQGVNVSFRNPQTGDLTYPVFHSNGRLHFAFVTANSSIQFCDTKIHLRDKVVFDENGELLSFTPKTTTQVNCTHLSTTISPFEVQLYSNKNWASLTLAEATTFTSGHFSGKVIGHIKYHENGILYQAESLHGSVVFLNQQTIPTKGVVRLRPNGQIHSAVLTSEFTYPLGERVKKWVGLLEIEKNGALVRGQFSQPQTINIREAPIKLTAHYAMRFHSNGVPLQACLHAPANLTLSGGRSIYLKERRVVRFDPNGHFIGSIYEEC